jgi:hypothetical protein
LGDEFELISNELGQLTELVFLAEIGLTPGADVHRASLETAMKSSDWAISQYDVLPDRVRVYLWPRAGGVKFPLSPPVWTEGEDRTFANLRLL